MNITKTKSLLLALFAVAIGTPLSLGACGSSPSKTASNPGESVATDPVVITAMDDTPVDVSTVKPTCTLTPSELAAWFTSGSVTKNGAVAPANSLVDFKTSCAFYKWSMQMFLWQMSPKGGGRVFNSTPFYDVDSAGNLSGHLSGEKKKMRVRGLKSDAVDGTGQAGVLNGVLMTQDAGITPGGSLVYYAMHVNNVYAYMASGINSGQLTGLEQFPTTTSQLKLITDYAKTIYGVEMTDSQALSMELKSSWVRADAGIDLSRYITIVADVPLFVKESDKKWNWDGVTMDRDVTLACVGYHLVGPSSSHPEMIWATFEHVSNAPDANYYYTDIADKVRQMVNWKPDGTPLNSGWLLMSATGKQQATDQMHMEMDKNSIVATPNNTISSSDTSRTHPWGGKPDSSSAVNNTEIISLNENIQSMLATGDVRANYFLLGATWTANGVPGVGLQLPVVEGSLTLANSTMETYFQFKNCFDCHQGNNDKYGKIEGLSHIFAGVKPLPVLDSE